MSARGKKNTSSRTPKKGGKKRRESVSDTRRSGLTMPVARIRRNMRLGQFAPKLAKTAPIYLTAILEYCVAEVLELAGNAAKDHKKKTIGPRHVMLGIKMDEELGRLTDGVVFPYSGTIENIHPNLMKKKKTKKKKSIASQSQDY